MTTEKVATYTYVNPVIAVFLGWLILSEPITAITIIAVVVILVAVILITMREPKSARLQEQLNEPTNQPTSHAALPARIAAEAPESDSVAL